MQPLRQREKISLYPSCFWCLRNEQQFNLFFSCYPSVYSRGGKGMYFCWWQRVALWQLQSKSLPDETIPFTIEPGNVTPAFQVMPLMVSWWLLSTELNDIWEDYGCMERNISTVVSGVTKQVSWRLIKEASCKILDFLCTFLVTDPCPRCIRHRLRVLMAVGVTK